MKDLRDEKGRFRKGCQIRLGSKHRKESLKKLSESLTFVPRSLLSQDGR